MLGKIIFMALLVLGWYVLALIFIIKTDFLQDTDNAIFDAIRALVVIIIFLLPLIFIVYPILEFIGKNNSVTNFWS